MGCIDADTRLEILGFFLKELSKHKPQTPSNQHPSLENEYCTKLTAPAKQRKQQFFSHQSNVS